jgi:hypothetical protein
MLLFVLDQSELFLRICSAMSRISMHPDLILELRDDRTEPIEIGARALGLFLIGEKDRSRETTALQADAGELLDGSKRASLAFGQRLAAGEHFEQSRIAHQCPPWERRARLLPALRSGFRTPFVVSQSLIALRICSLSNTPSRSLTSLSPSACSSSIQNEYRLRGVISIPLYIPDDYLPSLRWSRRQSCASDQRIKTLA